MLKIKIKDKLNRKAFQGQEIKKKALKSVQNNMKFLLTIRWKTVDFFKEKDLKKSKVKLTFKCLKTFSKKAFNKCFKLSRSAFFKAATAGEFSGFRKSVW